MNLFRTVLIMPRPPKPDDKYDDEAWGGLIFMCNVWNRGFHHNKVKPSEYHAYIKESIKRYHDNIEGPGDLALTIFVEFFFLNRDDGKHRYGYYIKGDPEFINAQTITRLQEDGSRTCYYPLPMYAWSSVSPLSIGKFPFGLYMDTDDYIQTRCLLKFMYDRSIIPKEFMSDYEFNQDEYEQTPYESIDFRIGQMEDGKFIEEKALDYVPDPLKVIENNEVEKLYSSILRVCTWLLDLFERHPEMF